MRLRSDLVLLALACTALGYVVGLLRHAPVVRDAIPPAALLFSTGPLEQDWSWHPGDTITCRHASDGRILIQSRVEGYETEHGDRHLDVDGLSLDEWRLKCHRTATSADADDGGGPML